MKIKKPEPLTKEKIIHARILGEVGIAKVTKIEDDKSAVQWLLKEIEKEINQWEHLNDEYVEGLKFAYNKIKKAFSEVVKE